MKTKTVLCLGEIMLRLKSPGHTRFFQLPEFEATFGGGEANVAVSLSRFGLNAAFVSAIPQNSIGDNAVAELRKHGVTTQFIKRTGSRLGIYFLEAGANQRPSRVIYDRENSSMATVLPDEFDWNEIFNNSSWLHITGITPAISATSAQVSLEAVKKAKEHGLTVSCDLNYRKKLWNYGKTAPEVMKELVQYVDIAIANEEDCQKCLGIETSANIESGKLSNDTYKLLAEKVLDQFPQMKKIAITLREAKSADYNRWSAILHTRDSFYSSKKYDITDIIDRVGGGDSFSAGIIYGLQKLETDKDALEYAVAASCLKHSIPGDFSITTTEEVFQLMQGDGSGRVQR